MDVLQYVLGGLVIALAIAVVVMIALQQGKRKGLENVISGNSSKNSYLNKTEAAKKGKKFEKLTLYAAIAFAVLVITMYLAMAISGNVEANKKTSSADTSTSEAA